MTDALPPIRIFLSPPDVGEDERKLPLDAFGASPHDVAGLLRR